jgi:hypothetical protein
MLEARSGSQISTNRKSLRSAKSALGLGQKGMTFFCEQNHFNRSDAVVSLTLGGNFIRRHGKIPQERWRTAAIVYRGLPKRGRL